MDRKFVFQLIGVTLIGFGTGLIIGNERSKRQYDAKLDAELEQTKNFYAKLHKADEFSTPEKAAAHLIKEEVATQIMTTYRGDIEELGLPEVSQDEADRVVKNIFSEPAPTNVGPIQREAGRPYKIEEDDFMLNEHEYVQTTITYYLGDGILADERDSSIDNPNQLVGDANLQEFAESEDTTVCIRNETLTTDFEIVKSEGRYAKEVMGLE